jgi:hypothetical protein
MLTTLTDVLASATMITGLDLKLRRIARRVKVIDLAKAMGYAHHSRISQIEGSAVVQPDTAERYMTALSTFPEVATSAGNGMAVAS